MDEIVEYKQHNRAMWAAGDYAAVQEHIKEVGERIVHRVGVRPGEDVLDVACGPGNAAIPAAVAGARVTGVDLTPELFEPGRKLAAEAGVQVEWVEGDAEALPVDDASVDVVLSTFGAMFAPRHDVTAREIARVLRPGGRLGLCNWTPEGSVGESSAPSARTYRHRRRSRPRRRCGAASSISGRCSTAPGSSWSSTASSST